MFWKIVWIVDDEEVAREESFDYREDAENLYKKLKEIEDIAQIDVYRKSFGTWKLEMRNIKGLVTFT